IILNFFFQAEDGIRDFHVTGVQTCALPIYFPQIACCRSAQNVFYSDEAIRFVASATPRSRPHPRQRPRRCGTARIGVSTTPQAKIGRASCRERVENDAMEVSKSNTNEHTRE